MAQGSVRLSVVVPTKDRLKELLRFLHSLVSQSNLPEEVVVVDASGDASLGRQLRAVFPRPGFTLKYVHTRRAGLTIQKNLGIRISRGDIVCFLDDDIVLENDFLKEIRRVFDEDQERRIGGVSGRITNPWTIRPFERRVRRFFYLNGPGPGVFQPSGLSAGCIAPDESQQVESVYGGVSAFRRMVLEEFPFDEMLHYWEDNDFSYRVSRKYELRYEPAARCAHLPTSDARPSQRDRMKSIILSQTYFFRKNFPQSFRYRRAYWLSLLGHVVINALGRNWAGTLGAIDGIRAVLMGESPRPRARGVAAATAHSIEEWGP